MKKSKKKRGKFADMPRKKPHTVEQENDIVLGQVFAWGFIVSVVLVLLIVWIANGSQRLLFTLLGADMLLFSLYNLVGFIFKWDHARVCVKCFLHKATRFDLRSPWSKEDTKDSVATAAVSGFFAVACFVLAFINT